jgi:hypothetical protein
MNKKDDIKKGEKFGNLTVLEFSHKDKWHKSYYICKCDCGNITTARDTTLKFHKNPSCGCVKNIKHGMNRTRLHRIWCNMKTRCLNKNSPQYKYYGKIGITLCEEWKTFEPFLKWALGNGYNDKLSIDRIDFNGGYSPQNCRWVDNHIQSANQRKRKSKSGYTGIYYHYSKYQAFIGLFKKPILLGCFNTLKEAVTARNNFIIENNLTEYPLQEI